MNEPNPNTPPDNPKPKKRLLFRRPSTGAWLRLVAALLVLALAWCAWRIVQNRPLKDLAGTYIVDGGRGYAVLRFHPAWGLRVYRGDLIPTPARFGVTDTTIDGSTSIEANGQRLAIADRRTLAEGLVGQVPILARILLESSKETPGDWDIVEGVAEISVSAGWKDRWRAAVDNHFPVAGGRRDYPKACLETAKDFLWGLPATELCRHLPSAPPIASFLHRLDDPRVADYFDARRAGPLQEATALSLIHALHQDSPRDLYLRLHLLETETLCGDAEQAMALADQWRKDFAASANPILRRNARIVIRTVEKTQLDAQGLNAAGPLLAAADETKSLQERYAAMRDLARYDTRRRHAMRLIDAQEDHMAYYKKTLNWIPIQIQSKCARITATQQLFAGEFMESLTLLAAVYHMGELLETDYGLIDHLIGVFIRAISAAGMEVALLNAARTPERVLQAWEVLERLGHGPHETGGDWPMLDGENFVGLLAGMTLSLPSPNMSEVAVRTKVSDAKFQNLRGATAALHRLLATGEFPATAGEFAPLLPGGLPMDPFSTTTLRFTPPGVEPFAVYSLGPDGVDDHAALRYDSTNGTMSPGDIFVRVLREPEFPFHDGPVRAANAYELLEQFPNGLPADPFADQRGMPMSILEATTTQPLVVFSWGPDRECPILFQETYYGGLLVPTTVPAPLKNVGLGTRPQYVFWRGGKSHVTAEAAEGTRSQRSLSKDTADGLDPKGRQSALDETGPAIRFQPENTWNLQAPYDPTNGTTSKGDMFIEIPPPLPVPR